MDEQKGKERNIAIKEGAYSMTPALYEALNKGDVIVFSEHGGQENHTAIILCGRGVEITEKQAERIKNLEADKENLRQYASGLENAQNLITVRYKELEAELTRLRNLLNAKV